MVDLEKLKVRLDEINREFSVLSKEKEELETAIRVVKKYSDEDDAEVNDLFGELFTESSLPNSSPSTCSPASTTAVSREVLSRMTLAEAAAIIVREAGQALTVMEIAKALIRRGYPSRGSEKTRNSLAGALWRCKQNGEWVQHDDRWEPKK